MEYLESLNEPQREGVINTDGPCMLIAGAGSGKTRVLTYRIAHLIQTRDVDPFSIMALTFTNKAAREMKERASKLVKGSASKGLTVSTFHNLGLNIIRREHKSLGFKPGFSIFDSEDSRSLLKELLFREGDQDSDLLNQIQNQIIKRSSFNSKY